MTWDSISYLKINILLKNKNNEEIIYSDNPFIPNRFRKQLAQTLKGHIYDARTNEPLVGAAVTYKLHGNQGAVSNINGEYEIKLPEGGVDLVFSYVGYEDVLMPIVINKREVITKDVYMKKAQSYWKKWWLVPDALNRS